MKNIFISYTVSLLLFAGCKKETPETAAAPSVEQQKLEYQQRELEIEKQKLAIEKEKLQYETQKKADSIAKIQEGKNKTKDVKEAPTAPKIAATTHSVHHARPIHKSTTPRTYASTGNDASASSAVSQPAAVQSTPRRRGMSKTAKGAIIGTAGGAAVGAIVAKKNRGLGAVIGGIVGGATGYTIGHSKDKKDGRAQ